MTYAEMFEQWLRPHANADLAGPMKAYMQDLFPFLGVKSPERVALTKRFIAEHGVPDGDELVEIVLALLGLPEREFHYTALSLLEKQHKKLLPVHMQLIEELILSKSWWDTVDTLASHLAGSVLQRWPELIPAYPERWIESDNLWLQRTAILFQLGYKERTDRELLFRYIRSRADSKEFFIRKAIGWALREYSKTDEDAVRRFVSETPLSPLSVREALKAANRKTREGGSE